MRIQLCLSCWFLGNVVGRWLGIRLFCSMYPQVVSGHLVGWGLRGQVISRGYLVVSVTPQSRAAATCSTPAVQGYRELRGPRYMPRRLPSGIWSRLAACSQSRSRSRCVKSRAAARETVAGGRSSSWVLAVCGAQTAIIVGDEVIESSVGVASTLRVVFKGASKRSSVGVEVRRSSGRVQSRTDRGPRSKYPVPSKLRAVFRLI